MSNSIGESLDLMNLYQTTGTTSATKQSGRTSKDTPSNELSFTDMLQLMVLQFQNQTMDDTADTGAMMDQLVQMSVVQAMTAMTTQMEQLSQASVMSYSASLVGKEVTVGVRNKEGKLEELVGVVTATGTYDGNQVVFLGDKSYLLSSVMAVGRLPEQPKKETDGVTNGETGNTGSETGGVEASVSNSSAAADWYGQRTVG